MAAVNFQGAQALEPRCWSRWCSCCSLIYLLPLYWISSTAFKPRNLATTVPPTVVFEPDRRRPSSSCSPRACRCAAKSTRRSTPRRPGTRSACSTPASASSRTPTATSKAPATGRRFLNSIIIAVSSTFLAVAMGTLTAYGFSRFRMPGEQDWLFFILSTRMLPPVVVAIPMFLMYRAVGLVDTHIGLIILYTAFNLSFSVWLMKGFIDEIPIEYEEAALVDGYTRMQAFFKIVLPQAATGIAATAVFCFITAWNEYAFALDDDQPQGADRAAVHSRRSSARALPTGR